MLRDGWMDIPDQLDNLQATRCSFSGRLDSDPDSTVYISGCPDKENMDIALMSGKVSTAFDSQNLTPSMCAINGLPHTMIFSEQTPVQ